jgi:hypothetical protein
VTPSPAAEIAVLFQIIDRVSPSTMGKEEALYAPPFLDSRMFPVTVSVVGPEAQIASTLPYSDRLGRSTEDGEALGPAIGLKVVRGKEE